MVDVEKVLWCVKNGDVPGLKSQLDESSVRVDDTSLTNNRPAIVCAADYGQTAVVEYLVKEKGADVNTKDQYGITPLLAAIWEGHVGTVEFLLQHKADKSLKSPGGQSYIEEASNDKIKALLKG